MIGRLIQPRHRPRGLRELGCRLVLHHALLPPPMPSGRQVPRSPLNSPSAPPSAGREMLTTAALSSTPRSRPPHPASTIRFSRGPMWSAAACRRFGQAACCRLVPPWAEIGGSKLPRRKWSVLHPHGHGENETACVDTASGRDVAPPCGRRAGNPRPSAPSPRSVTAIHLHPSP